MDALRVVVHGDREFALGGFLTDDILVKEIFYFQRLGYLVLTSGGRFRLVVLKNGIANCNTFVTNVGPRIIAGGRYQLSDNLLALMTKRTA